MLHVRDELAINQLGCAEIEEDIEAKNEVYEKPDCVEGAVEGQGVGDFDGRVNEEGKDEYIPRLSVREGQGQSQGGRVQARGECGEGIRVDPVTAFLRP